MHTIIVLFGLPGAGKTFIGNIFQDSFGYYLHDGDQDLTDEMSRRIKYSHPITDELRDEFFTRLIDHVKRLCIQHKNIVVTQTFIKEKYRKWMASAFPQAVFILVHSDTSVREQRLLQRRDYPLDITYARKMTTIFERPILPHIVLDNTQQGHVAIQEQLKKIYAIL